MFGSVLLETLYLSCNIIATTFRSWIKLQIKFGFSR